MVDETDEVLPSVTSIKASALKFNNMLVDTLKILNEMYDKVHNAVKTYQEENEVDYVEIDAHVYKEKRDIIKAVEYEQYSGTILETEIYGIRVNATTDNLEIITEKLDDCTLYDESPSYEDYENDLNWKCLRDGSEVYYVHTLFELVQYIEQYL